MSRDLKSQHGRGRGGAGGRQRRGGQQRAPSGWAAPSAPSPWPVRPSARPRASWSSTISSSWPGPCSVTPSTGRPCAGHLHERYDRLLLDEFQDTDPIQIELAVRIAAADPGSAAAGTRALGRGRCGARPPLRRGRPQAIDLPLPPGRHLHVLAGGRPLRAPGRRRDRAHGQLPDRGARSSTGSTTPSPRS